MTSRTPTACTLLLSDSPKHEQKASCRPEAHPERYAVQARQSKLLTHFSRRAQHLTITRRSFARSWQRICWRNYGLGRAPWYGADTAGTCRSTIQLSRALLMPLITSGGVGSLLTAETTTWNVGLLHSAPSRRLQYTGKEPPGSQFSVTLLRKMVRNLRLALRGHGLIFDQLHPLWRPDILVRYSKRQRCTIKEHHGTSQPLWRLSQLTRLSSGYFPPDVSQCC